jgi:hypothetical protein
MHSALFYFLAIFGVIVVAGGVIAFFALRHAPDGFEDEDGFTGITKGDEMLLNEFAQQRYPSTHSSAGLGA